MIVLEMKAIFKLAISTSGRYRRVSLIPVRPGEGRLTEPTAAIQPWRRELIFMPETVGERVK